MPHTGNAALDSKVHHELGEGGAPEEALVRMGQLLNDYADKQQKLTELPLNDQILIWRNKFDLQIKLTSLF